MHPILFQVGSFSVYSYGFFIALGATGGLAYMAIHAKKHFGLSFDKSNSLFIYIVIAAVIGGKVFFFFENPQFYIVNLEELITGNGFVFFGSLLFSIPTMLWFFKKHQIPTLPMLDIMAIVTCIVHGFGRIGCFMAGCCYGKPTDSVLSVIFTSPLCQAKPLNTPLHPTQLYESAFIFSLMAFLLAIKARKQFEGQLFLLYLIIYSTGRSFLEMLRGDEARGFIFNGYLSHSQLISMIVIVGSFIFYFKLKRKSKLLPPNIQHHGGR